MQKKVYRNIKTDRSVSLSDLTPVHLNDPEYWTTGQIEYPENSNYEYNNFLYQSIQLDYSIEGSDVPQHIESTDYWVKTNKIYNIGDFYSHNNQPKFCIRKDYSVSLRDLTPKKFDNSLYWNSKVAEVIVNYKPTDSQCFINNIESNKLKVPIPSTATIKIIKEGYDTIEDIIEISDETTYVREYSLSKVDSTIKVSTEPNNAIVKINNEYTRIKKVGYGNVDIFVELENYISVKEKHFIDKSGVYEYHYKMVEKPEPKCTIMVITDPEDARVLIDNEETNVLETKLGKHTIQVSKEGYEPQQKEVFVDTETTLMLSFILIKESDKRATFNINVIPDNAFITIDGKPYERNTQYSLGQRVITATAYGYKTYSKVFNLQEEKDYSIDINLAIIEAPVTFTTEPPEAEIILLNGNQRVVDKTIDIPFGNNVVQAILSGYYTITDNIDIVNEEPLSKHYILTRRTVLYELNITPQDSTLLINNEVSEHSGLLKSGTYNISIEKEGYKPQQFVMELVDIPYKQDIELQQIVAPITFNFNLHPYRVTINDIEIIMPEKSFTENIPYGEYKITAVAPTTKLVERDLIITTEEPQTIDIEFERVIGILIFTFDSNIEGTVKIDDLLIPISNGIATIQLYEGLYYFDISTEGYDPVKGSVQVDETREYVIPIQLTPVSSKLILTIYPTDSILKINDKIHQYVNGIFGTNLSYGIHTINISREGYETYEEVIENKVSTTITRDIYLGEI